MAMLVNTQDTADSEIKAALNQAIQDATNLWAPLKYEGAFPRSGFGIGVLMPRHVGIAADFWQTSSLTTTWANWISKALGTDVYVVIEGIFNLTPDPSCSQILITANGEDTPIMNIETLYAMPQVRGWFDVPLTVRPSNQITVQFVGKRAQTEQLGLVGHVIAKRSYLINKTP